MSMFVWSTRAAIAGAAVLAFAASGCGGENLASNLAKAPENPNKESMCGTTSIQPRPLVVEWPSSDRAALESRIKHGLVPVRFVGCDMEVLTTCKVPAAYGYSGITPKNDKVVIRNTDDLYANIPVHAAKFEAKLATAGSLEVAMTIIGRYESNHPRVAADELQGECSAATHVITALTVGAFKFSAGASAEVGAGVDVQGAGAGAKSTASNETLNTDGDAKQCEKATSDDKAPPYGCGALLRVELVPIANSQSASASASGGGATAAPTATATGTTGAGAASTATAAPTATAASSGAAASSGTAAASGNGALDAQQKACDGGDSKVCVALGEIYYNARGVPKDGAKAVELFKKACDKGEPTGCVDLGWAYTSGTGVTKDLSVAATFFEKACTSSVSVGCYGLAMAYKSGSGVARDAKRATSLFKMACSGGNTAACKATP